MVDAVTTFDTGIQLLAAGLGVGIICGLVAALTRIRG